jgi:hypothetical protein
MSLLKMQSKKQPNNMAHTKGNWFVQGDKYPTIQSRHNGDGIKTYPTIATVNSTFIEYEEYRANAKLIAAAPELLEALIDMVNSVLDDTGNAEHHKVIALRNAKQTIKKATE